MFQVNDNYLKLPGSYLFSTIGKKVQAYSQANPDKTIIRLGIGDVTQPLVPAIIKAMHEAVEDMAHKETFHGYAPDLGYDFLRNAIANQDYKARGCQIEADEIFISDGAKCDCGNIQEIFAESSRIAVCDPVYPVYVDSNVMAGRTGEYDSASGTWSRVIYMPCTAENGFVPELPKETPDLIYLCIPNNPTGTTLTKEQLKVWVDYANAHGSVILYDSAYEAFITSEDVPHTIFEIEGSRTCAFEFRSFSKTAGFTGNRCAYTVVPMELERGGVKLNQLWNRRQCTKFNGTSYIVQKGAELVFSEEGIRECQENIDCYRKNAKTIADTLTELGIRFFGGINSPYIWFECPNGMDSWSCFDYLLEHIQVVGTPGAGFGENGKNFFRLTAFGTYEKTVEAMERFKKLFSR